MSPIRAETALAHSPIVKPPMIGMKLGTSGEGFAVDPVFEVPSVPRSIARFPSALIDVPSSRGYERSFRLPGVFGNDVDDSVDGVRSPDRPARSANDFNPVDVFEQRVLNFPVHAGEKWRVHAAAVDEYEHRPGKTAFESAYAHRPFIGVDAGHFHSRHQTQRLRDAGGSGAPDILLREDINCRRGSSDLHWLFGNGRNLGVSELFQAQLRETPLGGLSVRLRICAALFH